LGLTNDITYDIILNMSKTEKILSQMRNNPRDWRIEDVKRVAQSKGLLVRQPGGGSSHVTFSHPKSDRIVTVPAHRPIKPVYIKKFLSFVDSLEGE
jgi:predicted RNA binding protein YcfA (HicA-like mRNA interferase family)